MLWFSGEVSLLPPNQGGFHLKVLVANDIALLPHLPILSFCSFLLSTALIPPGQEEGWRGKGMGKALLIGVGGDRHQSFQFSRHLCKDSISSCPLQSPVPPPIHRNHSPVVPRMHLSLFQLVTWLCLGLREFNETCIFSPLGAVFPSTWPLSQNLRPHPGSPKDTWPISCSWSAFKQPLPRWSGRALLDLGYFNLRIFSVLLWCKGDMHVVGTMMQKQYAFSGNRAQIVRGLVICSVVLAMLGSGKSRSSQIALWS